MNNDDNATIGATLAPHQPDRRRRHDDDHEAVTSNSQQPSTSRSSSSPAAVASRGPSDDSVDALQASAVVT